MHHCVSVLYQIRELSLKAEEVKVSERDAEQFPLKLDCPAQSRMVGQSAPVPCTNSVFFRLPTHLCCDVYTVTSHLLLNFCTMQLGRSTLTSFL